MKNNNCGTKRTKKSIITLFALCAVLMLSLVGCGSKSGGVFSGTPNVDGKYNITYYQKNGHDVTSVAKRNVDVEIENNVARIGGDTNFTITFEGKRVIFENKNYLYTGTYDSEERSFSIQGIDKKGVESIIEFEMDPDYER